MTPSNAPANSAAPAPVVRRDPVGAARAARSHLEARANSYLVHFDVDVLHTGMFPLANFPHFAGLELAEVSAALNVFAASQKFGGLVITEVNPNNDPDGDLIAALAEVVTEALAGPDRP